MIVGMERFGVAIPPVVARIFSGDSTSPLTREASVMVWGKGWCGDLSVDDALHCNRKKSGTVPYPIFLNR